MQSNVLSMMDPSPRTASCFHLSQLGMMQTPPEQQAEFGPVVIVAVYSAILSPESQQEGLSSVVERWVLESGALGLHPSFNEISSRKFKGEQRVLKVLKSITIEEADGIQPKFNLRKLDAAPFERLIVSLQPIDSVPLLGVIFDDGSVSFHDQHTMQDIGLSPDVHFVASMVQAGFTYPLGPSGQQVLLWPAK